MGGRYYITGVQLGILKGMLECDNWGDEYTYSEVSKILNEIQEKQFIGSKDCLKTAMP